MAQSMIRVSAKDWLAIGQKLFGVDRMKWRFRCISCGHVQTAEDLAALGVVNEDAAYFNCAGRYKPSALSGLSKEAKEAKTGCDWTLGGLFRIHRVEVQHPESGRFLAVFEFDHPEAQALLGAANLPPEPAVPDASAPSAKEGA